MDTKRNLFLMIIAILVSIYVDTVASLCSSTDYANNMRDILSQQTDYEVFEGQLVFVPNATNFVGTNPDGVYGATYFGNNPNTTDPNSISPKYSYFMRCSNILLFPICTPPKAAYFSITSYLLDRFTYNHSRYHRQVIWADLGATLNNLLWNTSAPNITDNYDSLTVYLQTADNKTYNDIFKALNNNDIPSKQINLQTLPNQYINFLPYKYNNQNLHQYNSSYDTAQILFRITIPDNQKDYQQYIHQNQTIFMLQPKNTTNIINGSAPRQPFEPYIRNVYSPLNFNEIVSNYAAIIDEYKHALISYLKTAYNLTYEEEIIFPFIGGVPPFDGFECIEYNKNCGGETLDAIYYQINNNVTLSEDSYFIIMGMIHTNPAIKQTMYSNIVYNDNMFRPRKVGSNPSITNFEYNNSAFILPVKTDINQEYLANIFVVQLAHERLCIDKLPGICTKQWGYGDLMVRNYLNPITKTRPYFNQILHDILLVFKHTN